MEMHLLECDIGIVGEDWEEYICCDIQVNYLAYVLTRKTHFVNHSPLELSL
jgi:hypothetical protein